MTMSIQSASPPFVGQRCRWGKQNNHATLEPTRHGGGRQRSTWTKTTATRQSSDGLTSPSPTTASARAAPEITTSTGASTARTTPKPGASSIPTPMWAHSAPSGNYSSSRNSHNSRCYRKGAASISRLLLQDGGFLGGLEGTSKIPGRHNKSRLPLKSRHQQEEREMLAEEVTPL